MKETCLDLWGKHIGYKKVTKAANFAKVIYEQNISKYRFYKSDFMFSLKKRINFRRKKKFKKNFLNPRLLYGFYLVLTRNNFIKYSNYAKKMHGYYIENYLGLIEGRIFMMAYRTNFITNLFMLKYIIRYGIFQVDNKVLTHYNSICRRGSIITFSSFEWLNIIKQDLLLRLVNNIIMWPVPKYLYINYKFMFVLYIRLPKYNEIVYPDGKFDIYIGNDYYVI